MLPLFFGFFTVKYFSPSSRASRRQTVNLRKIKKEPAIDIAGLCLPLKPQKEKVRIFFHVRLFCIIYIPGCRGID